MGYKRTALMSPPILPFNINSLKCITWN